MATYWEGLDGALAQAVDEQSRTALETYRNEPRRMGQDANIERSIAEGAYAKRQLFELVQNAADAMEVDSSGGRCEVVLTKDTLYVANSGEPFTANGVIALMGTHDSIKRDDKIGRFGLGFKSLLAVTDSPRVLSRSGSFVFDRKASEQVLGGLVPGLHHYPVMRWARALDPTDESRDDTILTALMKWATTVVVAPLKGNRHILAGSLAGFPAEFLLFSQHVERLRLEDRESGTARAITLSRDESGAFVLNDANRRSVWVVRSQRHHPSKDALKDGGYAAARESVEISWAAPLEGTLKGVGTFWAYFPTTSGTTLSGIVNAPWKLADDRESLLPGAFNDELLTGVLPKLVGDALTSIYRVDKPTAVLDVLPARGKEARNHADDILNEPVMRAVSERQCIPILGGGLRHPTRVRLHPDGLTVDELRLWASACTDPDAWTSHTVLSAEHRSKVVRLLGYHKRDAVTLRQWVEHLVKEPTVEGSAAAVRLVASLIGRIADRDQVEQLKKARVLLLEDGSVDACRRGQVFLPGPTPQPGRLIIDPIVAADGRVVSALKALGIEIFDNAGELRSELTDGQVRWDRVWASARKNAIEQSEAIFRDVFGDRLLEKLRVRTYSGKWKGPGDVFLAGEIIPADGSRDGDFLVDPRFHQQDIELLHRLGLVSAPRRLASPPMEAWREARRDAVRERYRKKSGQPRLADSAIDIDEGRTIWPLDVLPRLSDASRTALTASVMRQLLGDERWRITRIGGAAQQMFVTDMTWYHLRDHGRLRTQIGIQPVSRCLRWNAEGVEIDGVEQPLPYVQPTVSEEQAVALGLKTEPDELKSEDWAAILKEARAWRSDQRFLVYAWAAYMDQPPPDRIRVQRGPGYIEVPANEAAVTYRTEVFDSLATAGVPSVLATSQHDFEVLKDNWGMHNGEDMLTETIDYELAGEAYALIDRFPPLRASLALEDHDLLVQPCKRLEVLTSTPGGQQSRPLPQYLDGRRIFVTTEDEREILAQVARSLEATFKPDVVLRRMEEQRRSQLRQDIAETPDVLDKLLLAVGVEELRSAVPTAALEGLKHATAFELEDREIAKLALAVEGYGILQSHVGSLTRNGLDPPSIWAGKRTAREWVRVLGFPIEFAGFSGMRREAEMEIEGPPILGKLHEYQRCIADRVRGLLDPAGEVRRGLLSLPTGAGKTRVAVQALVEHMSEAESDVRILWLAETDELCEQATQTWSQVWRARGKPGTPMTLSRLWASNEPNERDGHQVVVASLAKLDWIINRNNWKDSYGWLVDPTIIVVDEAHRSIGPQYTRTLSAVGGTRRVADMTTPIIGLTATPFRGFNAAETEQLARRYHKNLLDDGVFPGDDVYRYLQQYGVLARIRHRELRGADVELTDDEILHATQMRRLPDSVENRLGQDDKRNNEIVRSVLEMGEGETALLFATSVENAKVLAALLTYNGVEARAVAGITDAHARRRYVEDFKAKRVRVLTNYNVFTEGFDVPEVDAVFITRPTFSPNVYQQMIGRGLRGPLNGGKDEVLIVNVADNLTNFGEEFAFRHFEHLWGRGRGR
ncbi:DEAD/DEAH box helicase family protein [Actinopolymorpha sp. B9G3]|uniref:sacsin N-terminal ATP-binding-like domain-containing protein n=1 Tax=Actinopolymorpha sp. B9G3 TaxID=3158970 RepID=UPI0032D94516